LIVFFCFTRYWTCRFYRNKSSLKIWKKSKTKKIFFNVQRYCHCLNRKYIRPCSLFLRHIFFIRFITRISRTSCFWHNRSWCRNSMYSWLTNASSWIINITIIIRCLWRRWIFINKKLIIQLNKYFSYTCCNGLINRKICLIWPYDIFRIETGNSRNWWRLT
jgi:hypothetical protein